MRYLVLSDIHANIDALETVLAANPPGSYDHVIVLGDLVGYGAEPNLVVERVRGLSPVAIIRGNHDKVAADVESAEAFNPTAQRAALWTRRSLTESARTYLRNLAEGPLLVDDLVEICHGSPIDEDAYIFGEQDAAEAISSLRRPVGLFGHTHLPLAVAFSADRVLDVIFHGPRDEERVTFEDGNRYLVNPGSVGQPRDGDPRAGFAVLDTSRREIVIKRIEYPVERARERIHGAGLPKALGNRLLLGR